MKILIVSPSLNPHGGIRVIIEWCNTLARKGHDVTLQVESGDITAHWINIDPEVLVLPGPNWEIFTFDVVVATTPPIAIKLEPMRGKAKKFYFLQMAEHLFAPHNQLWVNTCVRSYNTSMPLIGISGWVQKEVMRHRNNGVPVYYIGNGVSEDFKPGPKHDEFTVFVESWGGYPNNSNPAKDIDQLGPKAARHMKQKFGVRVTAYHQSPCWIHCDVPDVFYTQPDQATLIRLNQEAQFLIKASKYDARSTAPVEAMACGTTCARAILAGDDDLQDDYNCLESGYDLDALVADCETLYFREDIRKRLVSNGLQYRKKYLSWDYWMDVVLDIFENYDINYVGPTVENFENLHHHLK